MAETLKFPDWAQFSRLVGNRKSDAEKVAALKAHLLARQPPLAVEAIAETVLDFQRWLREQGETDEQRLQREMAALQRALPLCFFCSAAVIQERRGGGLRVRCGETADEYEDAGQLPAQCSNRKPRQVSTSLLRLAVALHLVEVSPALLEHVQEREKAAAAVTTRRRR